MNKRFAKWILIGGSAFATFSAFAQDVSAQSLFQRRSSNQIDSFRNYVGRNRGDILTVLINENTDVENRDERQMDKQGASSYTGGLSYGLGGGLGSTEGDGNLGHNTQSARTFQGDSEYRSERQFTDQFAVTIVDVLPNGNFLVAGHRRMAVQGDIRELRLTGVVRQFDVLPNNIVPSHLIANLKIDLVAEGPEQSFGKQGWFSRKMNKWWPF
ncbi:MAG: flagellar basal body L-ring protein FlgH [Planctomycetota bacterium]